VLRALRAGAIGFLLQATPPADILQAVVRAAAGDPFRSPAVLRQLLTHLDGAGSTVRRDHARNVLARLSDRERAVASTTAPR
jgi:DNA-binding NarL/FixJ family response regulator